MGVRKYLKRRRENKKELETVVPPDGGWGWVVCAAAFLIQFIVLGTMNNFGILYVKLYEDFGRKAFLTCKILLLLLFSIRHRCLLILPNNMYLLLKATFFQIIKFQATSNILLHFIEIFKLRLIYKLDYKSFGM
jgi:hypothetical protein